MRRALLTGLFGALLLATTAAMATEDTPAVVCTAKNTAVTTVEGSVAANTEAQTKLKAEADDLMAQLKAKKAELAAAKKEGKKLKGDLGKAKRDAKAACKIVERCEKKKKLFIAAKAEVQPIDDEVADLKKQLDSLKAKVSTTKGTLTAQLKLEQTKKCQELVEGKTAKGDIDACKKNHTDNNVSVKAAVAIHPEIGKLKAALNKARAKQKKLNTTAKKYQRPMSKDCAGDPILKDVDVLVAKSWDIESMLKELDVAKKELVATKKMKVKKPKVKKAPKEKKRKGGISLSGSVKGSVKADTSGVKAKGSAKGEVKVDGKTKAKASAKKSVKTSTKKAKAKAKGKVSGKVKLKL